MSSEAINKATFPLVSVVIPCLNNARYLKNSIDSVLGQDYPRIECIVIDGASKDGTLEILNTYNGKVRWVSEPDGGHADAINKGWKISEGQVLCWLNADDLLEVPGAVSRAMQFLQEHPSADMVFGNCGSVDADGNLVGMSYQHRWDLEYAIENCDHCIPQPAAFIRRGILERVNWLDENFISKKDHELWLRIGLHGNIQHVPSLLAHARATPGYLADRGDITAKSCVQLTRKFFDLPDIPAVIRTKRRRAISNAYLRGVDYAWEDGRHWGTVLRYSGRAILQDPMNAKRALHKLGSYLNRSSKEKNASLFLRAAASTLRPFARSFRNLKASLTSSKPSAINLAGDRDLEWSWVASQIPKNSGSALDFGPGGSNLGLIAAQRGYDVTSIDLEQPAWNYTHPNLKFVKGDVLTFPFPENHFDLILNCSTVEHVGLKGRYGVTEERDDGDLDAMVRLHKLMKPGGKMLLTIPVGKDCVFRPLHRIYGEMRLPSLLRSFHMEQEEFWIKDQQNRWTRSDRTQALSFEPSAGSWNPLQNIYALGFFVLVKQ